MHGQQNVKINHLILVRQTSSSPSESPQSKPASILTIACPIVAARCSLQSLSSDTLLHLQNLLITNKHPHNSLSSCCCSLLATVTVLRHSSSSSESPHSKQASSQFSVQLLLLAARYSHFPQTLFFTFRISS